MNLRKILTLTVEHNYYPDSICNCLQLQSNDSTTQFINKNGIIIRQERNRWALFKTNSSDNLFWFSDEYNDDKVRLLFEIICTDFDFYRSVKNYSTEKEINCICNKNGASEIDAEPCYDEMCKHFKVASCVVGKMYWKINLELDKAAIQNQENNIVVKFNSKEVYWKYLLFTEYDAHAIEIVDSDSEVTFSNSGNETLPDGTSANAFISNCKMPLRIEDGHQFRLTVKKNGVVKNVIKRLPVASVTGVRYLTNNKDDLVSLIFIHI